MGRAKKKYVVNPIPENQLTEIKSKIYATKSKAELNIYLSQYFNQKGLNGLTRALYKISSGGGYPPYNTTDLTIGLVIEKENERRSKESEPLLSDSEISEDEMYALPPCPAGTSMFTHVIKHLKSMEFGEESWCGNLLKVLYKYYNCIDGYCFVPSEWKSKKMSASDKALQLWAQNQRDETRKRKQWQTDILHAINFVGVAIGTYDYKFDNQVQRLELHYKENGNKWPDENTPECAFLSRLKKKEQYLDQYHNNEENKEKMAAIGWSYERIMKGKLIDKKDDDDWEKVLELEAFKQKTETTNVPYPLSGHGDIELIDLYLWKEKACSRYLATKDGNPDYIPLSERVMKKMEEMNVVLNPIHHHAEYRPENRHYDALEEKYRITFNVRDKAITDDPHYKDGSKRKKHHRRRPDAVMYQQKLLEGVDISNTKKESEGTKKRREKRKGKRNGKKKGKKEEKKKIMYEQGLRKRTTVSEFDERRHDSETVESEQRKVYHIALDLLNKEECGDLHWIRVNGGDRYQSHPDQEARHAELIRHIESLPIPPMPTVTVWLLDWPDDHYHVKAYQNRLMAIGERATEEDQWDSRPMYDEVFMCYSGGVPY